MSATMTPEERRAEAERLVRCANNAAAHGRKKTALNYLDRSRRLLASLPAKEPSTSSDGSIFHHPV